MILIIDSHNQFIRSAVVNPTLSPSGQPIGGIVGFLKSLQKQIRLFEPDRVILCWDGFGGSTKRKIINKNYKEGRAPIKINWHTTLSEDQIYANRAWQMGKLMEILNELPFVQLMLDGTEADDLISYIKITYWNEDKIIVSSDKDFYQIVDEKTKVYRPITEEIVDVQFVLDKHFIHPNNFVIARSIAGDDSDNLDGVRGAGLKTLSKRFQILKEEKILFLTDIFDECKNNKDKNKIKIFNEILSSKDTIEQNYKLMQLSIPNISYSDKRTVTESLIEESSYDFLAFQKKLFALGIAELSWTDLKQGMKKILLTNELIGKENKKEV